MPTLVALSFCAGVVFGALIGLAVLYWLTRPASSLHAETRRSSDVAVKRPAGKLIDARHAFGRERP